MAGIAARCPRMRTGVDIGFADEMCSVKLRERFPALWMTVVVDGSPRQLIPTGTVFARGADGSLPFAGDQFEVAVLNGGIIAQSLVREIHRVLRPDGLLFFSVEEMVRRGTDCTLSKLYNAFLKNGYDVVSVVRPPWWKFGRDGRMITVCARKKNWREHRPLKVLG